MPLKYVLVCDAPGCEQQDEATYDEKRGFFAPEWRGYNGCTFCSAACVAKYAWAEAQPVIAAMKEKLNGVEAE